MPSRHRALPCSRSNYTWGVTHGAAFLFKARRDRIPHLAVAVAYRQRVALSHMHALPCVLAERVNRLVQRNGALHTNARRFQNEARGAKPRSLVRCNKRE